MENNESIIFRGGLTMAGIVLLALLSMISSAFIAESSKGDAAAINLAGSLRMQSYRIATRLQDSPTDAADHAANVAREIDQFEHRLQRLWQTSTLSPAESGPKNQALRTIESFWRDTLRPLLENSRADRLPPMAYLQRVDDFVGELDAFVKLLEQYTETKILLLRLIQGTALFVTLILVFIAMYQLHTRVVTPLRDLVELARQAQGGDLSVRASHVGNDELGTLGHAFNLMAADLSAMYADLEARVEQQTQALQIRNRSLELLYHTARQLAESVPEVSSYPILLAEIEKLTGLGSVRLCLIDPASHQATEIFSTDSDPPPIAVSPFCTRPHCEVCLGDGNTHPLATDREVLSIPVRDQERQFGVLIVRKLGLEAETAWQLPLLETVACQIATALRAGEQIEHRHRLALLEERNAIARELHDSLAQSLSYLKIQVSRLQTLADGTDSIPESRAIIAELREVLNSAYRQLRELIATFRLRMEHPRLEDNLREAIQEFGRRGNLSIQLDLAGWHSTLDAHEQLQVMQIVREALNNAVKHARASQIVVRLREMQHGEVTIEVVDNGIGLPHPFERDGRFGLHIMRERADHLGGMLSLHSRPGDGLQVQLRFIPAIRRRFPNARDEVRYA